MRVLIMQRAAWVPQRNSSAKRFGLKRNIARRYVRRLIAARKLKPITTAQTTVTAPPQISQYGR
jgi:hypothetical protein